MSNKHYKPLGSQAIGVGDEIWGTCEACNELNRLTRELAEAKAEAERYQNDYDIAATLLSVAAKQRDVANAQLTAANATIAACREAGFIDGEGRVRGVAGKLFCSADNAIIGMDADLYIEGGAKADAVGNGFAWGPVTFCIDTAERFRRAYPLDQCYSTPAAAKEAQ